MPNTQNPSIFELFSTFFRLGLTAFGGPTMVVYMRKLVVEKKKWLDTDSFNEGLALCQSVPGATAMQTSAYVGLKTRGVPGALVSFFGFALPAFVMMITMAALYIKNHNLPVVLSAFSGLQAIIVAIIANAVISYGRSTLKDWKTLAIAAAAGLMLYFKVSPVIVIIIAALAGLALITPKPTSPIAPARIVDRHTNTKPLLLLALFAACVFLLLFLFDRPLFDLASLMFRIDLFAFGGGFASVPLMMHEIVDVRQWLDTETFMNGIVIGQVTPGPIVITSAFAGYLINGLAGSIAATFGMLTPSFLLVVWLTPYLDRLRSSPYYNKVVGGILCSFVGLLLSVTIQFALNVNWDLAHILLGSAALAALLKKVDLLWVVLVGTILSLFMFL